MDERLFLIGIAINELHKHGKTSVMIGEPSQAVGDVLNGLGIDFRYEKLDDIRNMIYISVDGK